MLQQMTEYAVRAMVRGKPLELRVWGEHEVRELLSILVGNDFSSISCERVVSQLQGNVTISGTGISGSSGGTA